MHTTSTRATGAESVTTTRRSLLAAIPVGAALSTIPALAATTPDAAILNAWERRKAALLRINAMPPEDELDDSGMRSFRGQWAAVDRAEQIIRGKVAETPRGAMIQILVSLQHTFNDGQSDEAAQQGDIAYLVANEAQYDWPERMAISALRSLAAMEA